MGIYSWSKITRLRLKFVKSPNKSKYLSNLYPKQKTNLKTNLQSIHPFIKDNLSLRFFVFGQTFRFGNCTQISFHFILLMKKINWNKLNESANKDTPTQIKNKQTTDHLWSFWIFRGIQFKDSINIQHDIR